MSAYAPRWFLPVGLAGVAAGAVMALPDAGPAPRPVAQVAAARLVGSAGTPLFAATDLTPGRTVTRCIVIAHDGTGGTVRMAADDVTGTLTAHLRLTVRTGTSGCAGLTGPAVYDGTLAALSAAGPTGVDAGWHPVAGAGSRTFAITVRVDDDDAQGRTAGATLRWLIAPDAVPAAPTVTPATPAPVRTPVDGPALPAPAATGRPATGEAPAPAPAPDGDPGPETVRADRRGAHAPLLGRVVDGVLKVLTAGSRHAAIPLFGVLVMLLFFAVQDRIDKRDPKLALAPLTRDRFLTFDDEPRARRGGRR
ncbi:hypothetical protein [Actinoplanes sp. NPDC049265]|uniref:hypothetical protein n=1 Tax=Actinoplanes sp. NPDC049265 TaxID=3363902 RepID=UPI003710E3D1